MSERVTPYCLPYETPSGVGTVATFLTKSLHAAPHEIEKVLEDPSRQAPNLVLFVAIEVRGIVLAAEGDVAHLGLFRIQQRFDRDFEDFLHFARLQHVIDSLVDDADKRRDEKSTVGDEIVKASDQLDVIRRNPDLLMRLANRCRFERLAGLDAAAGEGDLSAVRGEIR